MFFISGLSPSAFFPSSASASGPSSNRLLNYQLRLSDPTGIPVADGTKNIKISFYTASTGGTPVATDCGTTGTPVGRKVVFTNGVGSVLIGETTADASHNCTDSSAPNAISATLFDNTSLFIGITVEADAEMTPRKRIVATGYSLNADKLDDLDSSAVGGSNAFVPVTDSSGNFTLTKNVTVDTDTFFADSTNDRVGIGTTSPLFKFHVNGGTTVAGVGATNIVLDVHGSTDAAIRIRSNGDVGTFADFRAVNGVGLHIEVDDSEKLTILTSGNIGIGELNPIFKLDINGTSGIRVTGPSMYGLMLKSTDVTSDFMGIRWRDNANANLWSMGNDFNGTGNHDFWLFDNVNGETVLFADQAATSHLSFGTTSGGFEYDNVTQQMRLFTNGTNKIFVNATGNVGIGDATPASLLTVGSGDRFNVNAFGDVTSTFTQLDGTDLANGAGIAVTTLVLDDTTGFNAGNYVLVNSTYAKIVTVDSGTQLTISPALTWADNAPVDEYHIPEIGGMDTASTLANRYGRGYFIDGIVAGNGTTYITDNKIESTGTFKINAVGNQPVTFGTGLVTTAGLTVTGTLTTAAGQNTNFDSDTLVVDATNNRVGVATATPAYALDVTGDIRSTGTLRSNGSAVFGSNILQTSDTSTYFGMQPVTVNNVGRQLFMDTGIDAANSHRITMGLQTAGGQLSNGFTTGAILWSGTLNASSTAYDLYVGAHAHDGVTGADPTKMMTFKASNFRVGIHTSSPASTFDVSGNMSLGSYAGVNAAPANGLIVSGNVGIGTNNPLHKLHVVGQGVRVEVGGGDFPRFSLNKSDAGADQKKWQNYATATGLNFSALNDAESAENFWLQVVRGAGTAITSVNLPSGNVGIGTTSPGHLLDVRKDQDAGTHARVSNASNTANATAGIIVGDATKGFSIQYRPSASTLDGGAFADAGLFRTDTTVSGGMHFRAASSAASAIMAFGTNDTERMRIDNSGNIGINNTSPTQKLDVTGSVKLTGAGTKLLSDMTSGIASNPFAMQTSTANSTTSLDILPSGTGTMSQIRFWNNSDRTAAGSATQFLAAGIDSTKAYLSSADVGGGTAKDLQFLTAGSVRMTVVSDGNVGIGTTAPGAKLEIKDDNSVKMILAGTALHQAFINFQGVTGNTDYKVGKLSSTDFAILQGAGNTDVFHIDSAGDIGIGDSTPAALLTVGSGDKFMVNADGDVTSSFTILNGSTLANGSGAATTTLIVDSTTDFNAGNYVLVNATYAKIVTVDSGTQLTISPALTWNDNDAVTEHHIPEIGGTNLASTLTNRYGRGYFIDGIVAGNGSTFITDNSINTTSGTLSINVGNNQPVTFGTGLVTTTSLTVNGTLTTAAGQNTNFDSNTLFIDAANDRVGIGTASPNEQLEITGNFRLPVSTATTGIIKSGANRFIHNFGTDNFFAGVNAGNLTLTAQTSVGIGSSALSALTDGQNNVAVGYSALTSLTSSLGNVAVGSYALTSNVTGGQNVAIGHAALFAETGGNDTAVGYLSQRFFVGGTGNVSVGTESMVGVSGQSSGDLNSALGYQAGYGLTTGTGNSLVGYQSGDAISTGTNNVGVGSSAAGAVTTGFDNVAVGANALDSVTATSFNVAVGREAQKFFTTNNNTALGYRAMYGVNGSSTGNDNVAVGREALLGLTSGTFNTVMGNYAGKALTTANYNLALGHNALFSETTGGENMAIGHDTMYYFNGGIMNVAIGGLAMLGVNGSSTGDFNVAIGEQSLQGLTSGNSNVAVGMDAGFAGTAVTTGSNNVFLGYQSGLAGSGALSNAVAIGYRARVAASNSLVLGGTGADTVNVGIGTTTPIAQLHVPGRVPTVATGSVATSTQPDGLYVQGNYAYVTNSSGTQNLQIFDVSNPTAPVSIGTVSASTTPRGVYVQGKYAYVVTQNGTPSFRIYDVSNTSSPTSVSTTTLAGASGARVYVQGRYAYVTTAGTLQIFDVSNPAVPVSVGTYTSGSFLAEVFVQGRYAYVLNTTGNLFEVVDVSNPASPSAAGSVAIDSSAFGLYVQGRYAYVTSQNLDRLQVIDIANPASPASVGTLSLASGADPYQVYVQGRYAYIANSGTATMQVVDVSTPSAPVSIGTVSAGTTTIRVVVQGRYAYVLNFNGNNLQIFDVGGAYIQQLESGGFETGTLNVRNNLQALDADLRGGLSVGQHLNVSGRLGVQGNSTFIGNVGIGTAAPSVALDVTGSANFTGLINGDKINFSIPETYGITTAQNYKIATLPASSAFTYDHVVVDVLSGGWLATQKALLHAVFANRNGFNYSWTQQGTTPTGAESGCGSLRAYNTGAGTAVDIYVHYPGNTSWCGGATVSVTLPRQATVITSPVDAGPTPSGTLVFDTNSASYPPTTTSLMNGNVGIATTTPIANLQIDHDGASDFGVALRLFQNAIGNSDGPKIEFFKTMTSSTNWTIGFQTGVDVGDFAINSGAGTGGFGNARLTITTAGGTKIDLPGTGTGNALCHTTAGGTDDEEIVDCTSTPSADYAENYPTAADVSPGDIVAMGEERTTTLDDESLRKLVKAGIPYARGIMGVVSDPAKATDFNVIGFNIREEDHPMPIALNGRVKVTVSTENGPIQPGDPITASSTPGVGIKATMQGMIVGFALDSYEGVDNGSLMVFVNPGWWNGSELQDSTSTSGVNSLADLTVDADKDLMGFGLLNVGFIRGAGDLWSIDSNGKLTVKETVADKVSIRTTDQTKTIAEATIFAGSAAAVVENAQIKSNSQIFVTFKKNPKSLWWINETHDGVFILTTEQPVAEDTKFAYWIINVIDESTPPVPLPEPEPVTEALPIDETVDTDMEDTGEQTVDNPVDEEESATPEEPAELPAEELSPETTMENP